MRKTIQKNRFKIITKLLFVVTLFIFTPQQAEAQFFKKLAKKAKAKIEREADKRAEKRVNKKIDKEFDKAEDVLDGKKKDKKKKGKAKKSKGKNVENEQVGDGNEIKKPNVVWSKFDFIPGDEVIFEDLPSSDEENGEFPSRWDLVKGQVEIANIDGENVMMFIDGTPTIIPYLKNSKEDYLPEIFTIEFDFYKPVSGNRISVYLYDEKNQKNQSNMYMDISSGGVREKLANVAGDVSGIDYRNSEDARWIHVSIAFTKGKLKVYMDDTRVINIPHYEGNPTGLTLQAYWADLGEDKAFYFKNIRIAKGGVKYYDRVLSEGKIIVNGIKFDVNKATLKPESMGPINKIYELMQKNPDINFSVEGHTDNDGNDENNQKLSEARGRSVLNKLIEMGISANRLKSTGFGESKPIDNNGTPEGKANNRRVEFVKFSGNTSSKSSNSSSKNNSEFDKLDRKSITDKLESLPDNFQIPISNKSGIVNGKGTIILYATSDGLMGKMQILDVDKNDNYKLTVKYVTYKYNGGVHSQSNNLEVEGTYSCDLDNGEVEGVSKEDRDFMLKRSDKTTTSISSTDTTILKIYSN